MKTINILFIHPNFPGQFKALLHDLVAVPNAKVAFITRHPNATMEGVDIHRYVLPEEAGDGSQNTTHVLLRGANANLFETHEVTKTALQLKEKNAFIPHVVIGHIGWSGTLFIKDVFPSTKVIGYCEWFYRPETSWEYFCANAESHTNAEQVLSLEQRTRIRMQNVSATLCLESMDVGVSPMLWQRSVHPKAHQNRIEVIHEGIDTDLCKPYEQDDLNIPGAKLGKTEKIVTFISRSLEPARGFFTFMEAVEKLCKMDKNVQFVVVGRERSAYSVSTGEGPSYKQQAMDKYDCDWSRVHFTGKLSYEHYLTVLRNSSVHVYLSSPLFLSWSLLEAMSTACSIVSSNNAPVNEVIEHDVTGRLVSFFDADELAKQVDDLLRDRAAALRLGQAARDLVIERYDQKKCVKEWKQLILRTIQE
ncbi:MAG: glycosyltransferase [Arenicella sp.]